MTTSTILVRELCSDDISQVISLMKNYAYPELKWQHVDFSEDACRESIIFFSKSKNSKFFVALKNNQIVGYAPCFINRYTFSKDVYASDVTFFVKKEHRGSFVGKKLIEAMRTFAIEKGAKELFLTINSGVEVERTEKMLSRLGAEKIGSAMTFKL
jgi:GNAT superfamily N-acetyltransferase